LKDLKKKDEIIKNNENALKKKDEELRNKDQIIKSNENVIKKKDEELEKLRKQLQDLQKQLSAKPVAEPKDELSLIFILFSKTNNNQFQILPLVLNILMIIKNTLVILLLINFC
jgi:septal ring factor EnvC (AmiA/AmiB activator)